MRLATCSLQLVWFEVIPGAKGQSAWAFWVAAWGEVGRMERSQSIHTNTGV